MTKDEKSAQFWDIAQPLLLTGKADKGTMMGFPCLRVHGKFCASLEKDTADLIVKLPADRVKALIAAGEAAPFAPNGRTFREWARVVGEDEAQWQSLLDEAIIFVGGG